MKYIVLNVFDAAAQLASTEAGMIPLRLRLL